MQKKIIALAVAGLVSGAAFAQSNVTVYGIVDAYYAHGNADVANGKQSSANYINGGGLSGSRLGFKGTEDLGNGLKALFVLEYGLTNDANDGVGETLARQQLVGLTGNWGTVVAGRAQTTGYDFTCAVSPIAGSALDPIAKLGTSTLLQCGGAGRQDNAFAYISPAFSGLTFAYNHARVTENNGTDAGDNYGNLLSLSYANGPITAGLIYSKIDVSTAANADTTEWGLRASYDFGMAKLYGSYQDAKTGKAGTEDKWTLGVAAPISAAGTVVFQYGANDMNGKNTDSDAWTLAYTHGLSKRTTAYAGYTRVSNEKAAAKAAIMAPKAGGDSSVLAVGLRHSF
jgi:predicted porin